MKNLYFILAALLLQCLLSSSHAGIITHKCWLPQSDIFLSVATSPEGSQYSFLQLPDGMYSEEPGAPMLPYKNFNFLVPTFSNKFTVSLTDVRDETVVSLPYPIYPVQEDCHDEIFSSSIFHTLDSTLLDNYKAFIVRDYFVNGRYHIVSVAIPIGRVLRNDTNFTLFENVTVNLAYNDCDQSQMDQVPRLSPNSYLDVDLADLVVNPPLRALHSSTLDSTSEIELYEQEKYFYILTPQQFINETTALAALKQQRGYRVIIKTVEEILKDTLLSTYKDMVAFDNESHIRNWLISEYEKVGNFKLLILGDSSTNAPIRRYRLLSDTTNPQDEWIDGSNFFPSDSYFADVNSNFSNLSLQPNGFYSILYDKIKYNPTLNVGRLCISHAGDLSKYLTKDIIYQFDPGVGDPTYLSIAAATQEYDQYYVTRNQLHIQSFINSLPYITDFRAVIDSIGLVDYNLSVPTGKEVIDEISRAGIIGIQSHGSPTTIEVSGNHYHPHNEIAWKSARYIKPQKCTPLNLPQYINFEKGNSFEDMMNPKTPSVLFANSCSTAIFGKRRYPIGNGGDSAYPNIEYDNCTSFLFGGTYGGVAYIGYSYDIGIISGLLAEQSFGSALNKYDNLSRALLYTTSTSALCDFSRNLHGDPDIDIWRGTPLTDLVTVAINNNSLFINEKATSSFFSALDNATLTCYDGKKDLRHFILKGDQSNFKTELKNILPKSDTNDFGIIVQPKNCLPIIQLFSRGATLINESKTYILSEGSISFYHDAKDGSILNLTSIPYTLDKDGELNIICTRNFTSKGSFLIKNRGKLKLRSMFGEVSLRNENIKEGGEVHINAQKVLLSPGFTMEKGAKLYTEIGH